jgi:beta-glucosidase
MWFPGTEGGTAVANLLFGKANPSGKLPMSFPKSVGQCPIYYNRTNTGRPKTLDDDVHQPFVSGYIDCGNLPLFFFGEGLSYTEFKYEDMTLDKTEITAGETLTVTIRLTNSGEYEGKETVQLYLRDKVSSTVRPLQELIAFKKISLKPGESRDISFEVSEHMLRFWNFENIYVSELGEFTLSVGYADHPYFTKSFRLVEGR